MGAIEPVFLKTIRNRQTNAITKTVSDIFTQHLYPKYGRVDPNILDQQYIKVSQMTYDVSYPPDEVFEAIEDLMDMAGKQSALMVIMSKTLMKQ